MPELPRSLRQQIYGTPGNRDVPYWDSANNQPIWMPDRVFNIARNGARGNGSYENTQAFIDTFEQANDAGGGDVYVPEGVFLADTKVTVGGIPAVLPIPYDNVRLVGAGPKSQIITTQNAFLLWFGGEGKPTGFPAYSSSNLYSNKTVYGIQPVLAGAMTITCTTPGDAAAAVVGDVIYVRTGQLVAASTNEPDSFISIVTSVNAGTGVIGLDRPAPKSMVQEYYAVGSNGKTSRDLTANTAAPFGFSVVTAQTIRNVGVSDIALTGTGANSLIHGTQALNYRRERVLVTAAGSAFSEDSFRDGWLNDCLIHLTGSGSSKLAFAAAKGTTDAWYMRNIVWAEGRVVNVQANEGCCDIHMLYNMFRSNPSSSNEEVIGSRERARRVDIMHNKFINAGNSTVVLIGSETYDQDYNTAECGGRVQFNDFFQSGTATSAVQAQKPGWIIEPNDVRGTGFASGHSLQRNKGSQRAHAVQCLDGWVTVSQQSTYIGKLPACADVTGVQLEATVAFTDTGTDLASIGIATDHTRYCAATDVSSASPKLKNPTLTNGGYSGTERDVYLYYTGQNGNAGAGKVKGQLFFTIGSESP